ncbi:DUF3841 domain-containing protein [Luxibacter massiliensis]|uniref:DUF3841 domain-containing protein n=1 Tax=Luxibacter massiliensis TaxID=2219695 RepID=UPI000F07244F|nr:DUF3841 domain-containing protein [Luxibacter massiliensis]
MNSGKRVHMWTGQDGRVMETLARSGRYAVKQAFIEEKYQDTAWIFKEAYQFLASCAQERISRPPDAQSPVWVYKCVQNIHGGAGLYYLQLAIPEDQILIFDIRKWNRVLNLNFIGETREEEEEFQRRLERKGIKDSVSVFTSPFYPVEKQEIKKSWNKLLEMPAEEEMYVQGMTWEIRQEWIEKTIT